MIVFNIKAFFCCVAGALALAATGSVFAFGLVAALTDLAMRFHARGELESVAGPLFARHAGGTLFWIIPVWPLAVLTMFGGLGAGAVSRSSARAAAAAEAREMSAAPDDRHLIAPPPSPVPTSVVAIESDPVGATITINGGPGGTTPASVRVPAGAPAEFLITLPGHRPVTKLYDVPVEPSTITVKLERGVPIEVISSPEGAQIAIDGVLVGVTPSDALVVPEARSFKLTLSRPGYRPWTKKVRKPARNQRVVAKLAPVPLDRLPLDAEEKRELRELTERIESASADFAAAQRALARAKATQARRDLSTYARVEVEDAVAEAEGDLEARRADLDEAKAQLDGLQERVRVRLAAPE